MSYRKVLRYKFIAICNNCDHKFTLAKDLINELEEKQGIIPFSATKKTELISRMGA